MSWIFDLNTCFELFFNSCNKSVNMNWKWLESDWEVVLGRFGRLVPFSLVCGHSHNDFWRCFPDLIKWYYYSTEWPLSKLIKAGWMHELLWLYHLTALKSLYNCVIFCDYTWEAEDNLQDISRLDVYTYIYIHACCHTYIIRHKESLP